MLAIEHQLNRLTTLLPAEGGILLRHKEGQLGAHHRLVVPTCQQHPSLMLGHTEHLCLRAKLNGVGLLGVAPRCVTATLNLGLSLGKQDITLTVVNHHLGGYPSVFILNCLIVLGVNHHNGQTRKTLITDIELNGNGYGLAIRRGNAINNRLAEIHRRLATDLRLALSHYATTRRNGKGRYQLLAIDIIWNLAAKHAVLARRKG